MKGSYQAATMDKQHILNEIRRTAKANDGKPLGQDRFQTETGIRKSDWFGIYWARWGDALQEAGFAPNTMQTAYPDDFLIKKLIYLIRELKHFPVSGELRLKARSDPRFPSHSVFGRLGSKKQLVSKVLDYCKRYESYDDIIDLCTDLQGSDGECEAGIEQMPVPEIGFVYLAKSGRHYKIGKSNSPGRREYELKILLPEKLEVVHKIQTDDPSGIEAYWHERFKTKRKQGEWFELSTEDISAFKRRKFM